MSEGDAETDLGTIRRKALIGIFALGARGGAARLVNMASMILLARLLTPEVFGTFALVQLPVVWINLLADAGISGALIQGELLSAERERAGFTLRLLLAGFASLLLFLMAGFVGEFYALPVAGIAALRLMGVGTLIGALGTIPSVRLIRKLQYDRLSLAELGSLLFGQSVAVGMALRGYGLWSLVAGSLATVLAGTLLVNLISPWRASLLVAPGTMRALLQFGLRYQGQGVAHLAKDQLVPALGGLYFGKAQLGQLNWAVDVARWPRLPADIIARVGFPAYARLQRDPAGLARLTAEAATATGGISFIAAILGILLAPSLVPLLFGNQWLPAVPLLRLLLLQTPFDALAAVLLPLIYATGRAGKGLWLSIAWAASAWLIGAILLRIWPQPVALPVAISLSSFWAFTLIRRHLPLGVEARWTKRLHWPAVMALMLIGIYLVFSA